MRKQRPILFNTETVLAIDGDTKTETRRTRGLKELNEDPEKWKFHDKAPNGNFVFSKKQSGLVASIRCPYGEPGDYLYVRETWMWAFDWDNGGVDKNDFYYRAGHPASDPQPSAWKPSIHMPKEAARIWLQIVEVRIERLRDITEDGARCEGVLRELSADLDSVTDIDFNDALNAIV